MNDLLDDHEQNVNPYRKPPLRMGFGFLPRLRKPGWIELAILYVKRCPKYFLKPGILLALALSLPVISLLALKYTLTGITGHGVFKTGPDIFLTFVPGLVMQLVCVVGALVCLLWGLAKMLIALTATCRSFLIIDSQHFVREPGALERAIATAQDEGVEKFRKQKGFLAATWLMYSLLMTIPTGVMFVSCGTVLLGMPAMGEYTMLPTHLDIPMEMMMSSALALSVSIIVLSNYALILMPYSSLSERSAPAGAIRALLLSIKTLPAISLYSVLFFLLTSFLSSPIDLLLLFNQNLANHPLMQILFILLRIIWHVLFFVYIVPISMLIPCEMIRGNTD